MPKIQLNGGDWSYDEDAPLGPAGGFGEVFRGKGPAGTVAVKRLKLTASAAAHREMNIGQALATRTLNHVVPVLDFGQDAGSDGYFLVMPICERSLQDSIEQNGILTLSEARSVALDILSGLQEVGDIVHRDLKPGNVLFYHGAWRLADFGIAKFVEDSTSLATLRGSLTPAYGAPEQWRGEAPSHTTDVYSLGCMLHTMLSGAPPFRGSHDAIREAHLHHTPPELGCDVRLSAFVGQMLRKVPASRPTIERCAEVIASVDGRRARSLHAGLLAAAGQISKAAAEAEAAAQAAATAERERQDIVREASSELDAIIKRLFSEIKAVSDEARIANNAIELGLGSLVATGAVAAAHLLSSKQNRTQEGAEWSVAAGATLSVRRAKIVRPQRSAQDIPIFYAGREMPEDLDYKWSASLFYGRSASDPNYRWREVAFWTLGRSRNRQHEPLAIASDDPNFHVAFSNTMGTMNIAYGPFPIDGEDEDAFQRRWLGLFAQAATGKLNHPGTLPVPDAFLRQLAL